MLRILQENRLKNEEKLSSNSSKTYVTLDEIPTWKEQTEVFNKNEKLNDKVSIFIGDITTLLVDAIVNATDNKMSGAGGVDSAIHKAAGKALNYQCKILCPLKTGNAKVTFGGNLPAKYVIHTAGPTGSERDLLEDCYKNSLTVAVEKGVRSIAFPCISTGNLGYPRKDGAHVALRTVRRFLEVNDSSIDRVIFCLFLPADVEIYKTLIKTYFPV